jgi:MFS family permease
MLNAKRGLYLYTFLSALGKSFTISSDTLFFLSQGLTYKNISTLSAVMCIATMLCEIPTGIIADRYGRKYSLIFSTITRGIGYLTIAQTSAFSAMVAAYAFFGIGFALQSGAVNAWLVSILDSRDRSSIQSALARLSNFSQVGNAAGALAGGFAFTFTKTIPWYGGLASMALGLAVLLMTKETFSSPAIGDRTDKRLGSSLVVKLKSEVRFARLNYFSNPVLMVLLFYSCVGTVALVGIFMLWQPWFSGLLGPDRQGLIGSIWMCFTLSNLIANRFVNLTSSTADSRRLMTASLLAGLPLIVFSLATSIWIALPFYMLHVFGEAFKEPIVSGILHDQVDDSRRATIESYHSLFTSIVEAFAYLMMGWLIDEQGMRPLIYECIAVYLFAGLFAYWIGGKSINGITDRLA